MAMHSSILAWEISWTEGPGGLQSMGSQRVRHELTTKQQQEYKMVQPLWKMVWRFFLKTKYSLTKQFCNCASWYLPK